MSDDFTFHYGPQLVSGIGASANLAPLLPDGPVLFVTDANLRALGLTDAALSGFAGRELAVFDEVQEDPSEASALGAVELGRSIGAKAVIGFGGGSPMDVAKAAAYLLGSGEPIEDIYGVGAATGEGLPLVLVPTTAGTGSEATPISILTVGETSKKGIVAPALYADWAVLDAGLTTGLPRHVTAATGVDAMVHAIEAFTTKRLKNPVSDALAKEALRLLSANIRAACDTPNDLAVRDAMLRGSYLAGVAFANAPCAGVHALAYPLGGHFHVPHGLSNALMLPHVLAHNMPVAREMYAELAVEIAPDLASLGTQARAQCFVEALVSIAADIGLSPKLADVGIEAGHLDLLADEAMKQERLLVNNPVPITREDARRMYEAAL
ncbi:iron-containing alcohol dehydrogenase [Aurantiacibacter sp. MUD11]|uniref:iron-containing alcohol dehydrogenase n=1 Tax=Aurantiacibacter sp. MUD11 TaxID=3003265 RepID=UPI0022AAC5B4|nr:iron-containing alcohol dehydrogenase [Aurantiacibacter sp. MUD11]WAT18205.1 iron-containing alcohol dehydrogenase [Aurantiacibacter sp. MUD11]